jgi:nicotinamidase-related amidase
MSGLKMVSIDPSECAVLAVDMQNDFCDREGHYGRAGEDVSRFVATIDPVQRLIARARGAGATIAFTRLVYDPTKGAIEERHKIKPRHWIPKGRRLQVGSWGAAIVDPLAPRPGDIVVDKPAYSAFEATDLEARLRQHGVTTLIVCGVVTYACVLATAFAAFDKGFDILLAKDATGSWNDELGDATTRIVDLLMGQAVLSSEVEFATTTPRTARGQTHEPV